MDPLLCAQGEGELDGLAAAARRDRALHVGAVGAGVAARPAEDRAGALSAGLWTRPEAEEGAVREGEGLERDVGLGAADT